MNKRAEKVCMFLGAMLMLAALSLALWNYYADYRGKQVSQRVLEQLQGQIPQQQTATLEQTEPSVSEMQEGTTSSLEEQDLFAAYTTTAAQQETETAETPMIQIEEDWYIGILTIPALGVELPVLEAWSYANLRKSPCRYEGDPADDNLILAAHNYHSHFGNIGSLEEDDTVLFTDCAGTQYQYQVSQIEEVNGNNAAKMEEGDWDLTLFTCTYSGKSRVTVRCKRVQAPVSP